MLKDALNKLLSRRLTIVCSEIMIVVITQV